MLSRSKEMKIKNTFILLLTAFSLTACASKQPLVSDISSDRKTQTQARSEQTTVPETVVSKPETLAADWSNRNEIVSQTGTGGTVNILNKDKTEPLNAKTVMHGGKVESVVDYTIGLSGYPASEKAQICFCVTVGGKLCEFELAGEKSSGGMLCTEKNVNTELFDELVITDCDLVKGENKLCIMYSTYYPQLCTAFPTKLPKTFTSDVQTTQSKPIVLPQRYDDKFVYSSDKTELAQSTNFVFDQIRYDEQKAWSEVKSGTDVSIKLINIDMKMTGSVKRDMLIFVLQNGKPVEFADGKKYAMLRLEQIDCSVDIPLTKFTRSGQHELLTVCCFDMSEAVWCFRSEQMFLVK